MPVVEMPACPAPWTTCSFAPDVAISASGDVLVVDLDLHCVLVFRPDGTLVRQWGSQGSAAGQFDWPLAVAVSSAGDVFVFDTGNRRVQVFRLSDGSFVRSLGSPSSPLWADGLGIGNPSWIFALSRDERELFAGLNERVVVWSLSGQLLRQWDTWSSDPSPVSRSQVQHLVVSLANEVLVTNFGSNRVKCFDRNGVLLRAWGNVVMDVYTPAGHVRSLAISPATGELFVTGRDVQVFA